MTTQISTASSSTFIQNGLGDAIVGVNGSDVYRKPVGDGADLLALFGALNRTMPLDALQRLLEAAAANEESFVDLVVLAFHTRDILEGKGERALFYRMIWFLYQKNPMAIHKVLHHVSEYGAWFDLQKLLEMGLTNGYVGRELMDKTVVELYAKQLLADAATTGTGAKLSLAAKWVPRENKSSGWLASKISKVMFPTKHHTTRLKMYRQLVSGLNARLNTVERNMCHDAQHEHHFASINPGAVPSRCMLRKRAAFFNEPGTKANKKRKTGRGGFVKLRFPDDEDREMCRQNFEAHVKKALSSDGKAKVHGKVLMPHEFVVAGAKLRRCQDNQSAWDTLQAQWNDMRDTVRARQSLGKTVVMCDFSGSMDGMPMDVSKGLGILCAECTSPAFRDRMLTFDSVPTWHNLAAVGPRLHNRLNSFGGVSQGTSTNFQAAVDLVLNRLVEAQVPVGDEPDILLVLTDMGWDQANNAPHTTWGHEASQQHSKFETHIDRIKRDFAAKGGWKVPTIVIWNISGKFQEYHHKSDTPGVCVVSGWSPAILKYIMQGDDLIAKLQTMTPYKLMRQVLDDARYTPIRQSLAAVAPCLRPAAAAAGEGEGEGEGAEWTAVPVPEAVVLAGEGAGEGEGAGWTSVPAAAATVPATVPATAAEAEEAEAASKPTQQLDGDLKSACTIA